MEISGFVFDCPDRTTGSPDYCQIIECLEYVRYITVVSRKSRLVNVKSGELRFSPHSDIIVMLVFKYQSGKRTKLSGLSQYT